ncbi:MAG: fibronectin type III domain-containing protein [Chitinivibrionia bacterium]|nr:fibronectin type III domain-containing protein [Chitinivibrionia bacterium]
MKAPSGVKAESLTSSSITITWNNFANATGYRIYKSERSSSYDTYTEIGTSTTNTYTDTGLPFNTTYFYKVSARNDALEGDQSSYVNTTVLLHAPVNVTAVGSSSSSIIISWDAVMGANSYNVYISESSSGLYTKLGNTNSLSYTSSKLATATTYYYKVEALTGSYGSGTGGQLSEPVPGTTN